jgi:CDP-glycerol glycerophosphotransferase
MTTPLLSVVVPFHGVEHYIGACLTSLSRQTLADLEVILVDDGSRDGSAAIAAEVVGRDPRFRMVAKEPTGPGPARDAGIALARGRYLAFADADDLVPWHAYERMVGTLEATGSSFVATNARRFNTTGGVRPSWLHRGIFTRRMLATHVSEWPALALDRMVWNKVYRLDFWRDTRITFPAIRYEDYPVALAAHLAALTVDVLPDPLYHWRERESGDSITQQALEYDNLRDRVESAEMIFALVEDAVPEIRRRAHAHLAEIDLTALTSAFGVAPDADVERLVRLGQRFAARLDPTAVVRRPRFDRVQVAALRAGDVGLLRELAGYREAGRQHDARIERRPDKPWILENDYPGRGGRTVPRETYRMPRSSLHLTSRVTDVRWSDTHLVVRGTAHIRHLDARASDGFGLTLLAGSRRIPVPITRLDTVQPASGRAYFAFEGTVDLTELRDLPWVCWPVVFQAYVRHGTVRRRLPLRGLGPGSPTWPRGTWLRPDVWTQTSMRADGALQVATVTRPVVVDAVTAEADAVVLGGRTFLPIERAELLVVRRAPFVTTALPATLEPDAGGGSRFRVRLPLDDLESGETPEDPFLLRNQWDLRLRTPTDTLAVLWPPDYPRVTVAREGYVVTVTTTAGKYLVAMKEPAMVTVEEVSVVDGMVTTAGCWWSPRRPEAVSWRRYRPNSDDHVDVPVELVVEDGRWRGRVALDDVAATVDEAPGAAADWSLSVLAGGAEDSARCVPRLGSLLPRLHAHRGSSWRLGIAGQTLHLEAV